MNNKEEEIVSKLRELDIKIIECIHRVNAIKVEFYVNRKDLSTISLLINNYNNELVEFIKLAN